MNPSHAQMIETLWTRAEIELADAARRSLSLVAVPAFVWFSTRLFAGMRTALNSIYDVSVRPKRRHFLLSYLLNKLRDLGMVIMTLTLFLANAALSVGLSLLQGYASARGRQVMATYADMEELIRLGAYRAGSSAEVDEAIRLHEPLESFLRQAKDEVTGLDEGYRQLEQILGSLETER